ncbi:hypothetical protein HKX48_009250 [Thoreauomyces humboldtii]|nr:hypothetical protein HKX48_009250 [Thoreauomyces humboldtii]
MSPRKPIKDTRTSPTRPSKRAGATKAGDVMPDAKRDKAGKQRSGVDSDGLFRKLLDALERRNPRVFELPQAIVDHFEHVYRHPATGIYVDTREVEVTRANKGARASRRTVAPALGTSTDLVADRSTVATSMLCSKCGESGHKLCQAAFLSSNSVAQTEGPILNTQAQRTELIKCDYCPLVWHLDCLDPPLTSVPPELKEDEKEIVDAGMWNGLRTKYWGTVDRTGTPGTTGDAAAPAVAAAAGNSGQGVSGVIELRRKWMCPCHVDWSLPKLRVNAGWKWVDVVEKDGSSSKKQPTSGLDENVSTMPGSAGLGASKVGRPKRALLNTTSSTRQEVSTLGRSKRRGLHDDVEEESADYIPGATVPPKKQRLVDSKSLKAKDHSAKSIPMAIPRHHEVVTTSNTVNNGHVEVVNDLDTDAHYAAAASSALRRKEAKSNASSTRQDFEELDFGGVKYRLPERSIKLQFLDRVRSIPEPAQKRTEAVSTADRQGPFREAFGYVERTFRSRVDELYGDDKAVRGVDVEAGSLAYVASVAEQGVARRCAGKVRATDREAVEWLESVSLMQSELAYLLNRRRAANAYVAADASEHSVDLDKSSGLPKESSKVATGDVEDREPLAKDAAHQPFHGSSNEREHGRADKDNGVAETKVTLRATDPEWVAFCAWRKQNEEEEKRA